MKRELRVFFTALMFYTRIPCPRWVDHDPDYMRESARYFSFIGWIVGGIGALVFWLANQVFSVEISLVLSIAATIRTTGGFHEDGLADVCDGFGGGWTKDKIIMIMKDSTLGTFGVLGLIIVIALKFLTLNSITPSDIPFAILAGHVLSRLTAARMLARGNYVENNNAAKAGSAAQKLSTASLLTNLVFGLAAFLLFQNWWLCLALFPLLLAEAFLYRFYKKWIGGYNGDCAGAVQQLTEVLFYLSLILLWKYT
jgi:adenosylcobinamide-GDP ribazoletransferase